MGRGTGLVVSLLAAAFALGGCVAVQSETPRQVDQIGDVVIETTVCASRPTALEGCEMGNSQTPAGSGEYQLLIGYRVPRGARAPESIASDPRVGADIAVMRSDSYTSELQRLAPAPENQKWVGYISPAFGYQTAGGDYRAKLLARFELVRGDQGAPFEGPFRYRTIVGYRPKNDDTARPVACGESLTDGRDALCMDWPSPEQLPKNREFAVRDLGIVAGPLTRARRGTTASVPFTILHTGGDGAPAFTMNATTTAPGAEAAPQAPTFAPPKDSASLFLVPVEIPAGAPVGTYDVVLTAMLANGQTRTARGRLAVRRTADGRGPSLAIAVPPRVRLRGLLRSGLPVDAACGERCTLGAQLRIPRKAARRAGIARARTVRVGSGRARIASKGRGTVRIEVTPALRARMARLRGITATVRVQARDRAGNRTTRAKRVRLR